MDRNVGAVVAELRKRDLHKKTVIVIGSDHGEGFLEHGLEGHARTLYREVAEVPFIISLPFELSPGIVVPQTVANVDIWPTVLDLFGLPTPGGTGRHLAAAAGRGCRQGRGPPTIARSSRRSTGVWGRPSAEADVLVALTQGNYRAMRPLAAGKEQEVEYFDVTQDPWEAKNLAATANGGQAAPARADLYVGRLSELAAGRLGNSQGGSPR